MPKILQSVLASLPPAVKSAELEKNIEALQDDMRQGAQLRLLTSDSPRVGANAWNQHLEAFIERGEGWHTAPWWLVENYMYKRLLEDSARSFSIFQYPELLLPPPLASWV